MNATTITRIITIGDNHAVEFLEDGSVDIIDLEKIGDPSEYVHLSEEEAYKLLMALQAQFTGAMNA